MEPPFAVSKYPGCKPSPRAIPAEQAVQHQPRHSALQTHPLRIPAGNPSGRSAPATSLARGRS